MPWMWLCGCLSTQPWWRPYSVAWIVIASGAPKRFARWSPATATSQSWPCTRSKSKRSPSSTPAASMSVFMCSTQAMNSRQLRRALRLPHAVQRARPRRSSSAGDSSRPRVSTWTSTPWQARFSDELAHVAREAALDQRRVLPGEDQDAHRRSPPLAAGATETRAASSGATARRPGASPRRRSSEPLGRERPPFIGAEVFHGGAAARRAPRSKRGAWLRTRSRADSRPPARASP